MKVFNLFLFLRKYLPIFEIGSQVALVVNNLPANAGDIRDLTLIPGSRRPPAVGNGKPLQYSCLESHMNREASWATVHGVTKNWTQLKQVSQYLKLAYL